MYMLWKVTNVQFGAFSMFVEDKGIGLHVLTYKYLLIKKCIQILF